MESEKLEKELPIHTYETVVICNPDKYADIVDILSSMCKDFSAEYKRKAKVETEGIKTLAYPMKRDTGEFTKGHYTIFTWRGTSQNAADLERTMRIHDEVLKFITIKLDDTDDILEDYLRDEYITSHELEPATEESEQDVSQDAWDKIFN
jgi:small subunit ribosomal protein S6